MSSFLEKLHIRPPPDRPLTNELLPDLKDAVFHHQLSTPDFCHLDEEAILKAEIAPTHHKAKDVLKNAHKIGMIDPITGRPDTTKVTRNMVNDMPVLGGISKQREFVMLLFFWEEEVRRWEALDGEEREIQGKLGEGGVAEGFKVELEEALKMVQGQKRVLPSLRDQSGNVIGSGEEQLPAYAK